MFVFLILLVAVAVYFSSYVAKENKVIREIEKVKKKERRELDV